MRGVEIGLEPCEDGQAEQGSNTHQPGHKNKPRMACVDHRAPECVYGLLLPHRYFLSYDTGNSAARTKIVAPDFGPQGKRAQEQEREPANPACQMCPLPSDQEERGEDTPEVRLEHH